MRVYSFRTRSAFPILPLWSRLALPFCHPVVSWVFRAVLASALSFCHPVVSWVFRAVLASFSSDHLLETPLGGKPRRGARGKKAVSWCFAGLCGDSPGNIVSSLGNLLQ